jgi:type IV pilus assembly protein PilC
VIYLSDRKKETKSGYVPEASARLDAGDLSLFCYQLSLIFKSGMPFLEGMSLFAEEMAGSKFKKLSRAIYQDVFDGKGLSASLEKQGVFPAYMVGMIRMAEVTGKLDSELERLSAYYDKAERLNRRIRNAVTYPIILAVLMGCIILLLILKILPMFHEILVSVGADIPAATLLLLDISTGIRNNSVLLLLLLLVLAAAVIVFGRTPGGRKKWDEFKVKAPFLKNIHLKMIAARFSIGMSMLLQGGIAFDDALGMLRGIVGNSYVSEKVESCRKEIHDGGDPSDSFGRLSIFPALFVKMLHIGYKTGELEKTVGKIADIYENEVDRYMGRVTSAIEPVLVIILSAIVGVILLAVMLPLISIMSSIG